MSVPYRHLVERTARMFADQTAVICGDQSRTFSQLYERACRFANVLAARGHRPGDRVGVLLPNCIEYAEIDVGLALAGLVRVSLNARATAVQHRDVLRDAEAQSLVYAAALSDALDETIGRDSPVDSLIRVGDPGQRDALDYTEALAAASAAPPQVDPGPQDLYCLFYTSGTTGRPKGVMLTHGAYLAVARNLLLEYGPVVPGEKILLPQPLSHGAGFFLPAWFMSGGVSIVMERYDPDHLLELAESHAIETLKVVPTMLLQLLATGIDARRELPSLRQIIYGASPMPAPQLEELLGIFGGVFAQLYGQAEAPMCITVLTRQDHLSSDKRILTSAGRPYRTVEVRVVDEDGRDVRPGERGEVTVRGDHLMSGYWRQPELTAEVLRGGYVHTRDQAEMDERGFIYLLGRTDDMIISGGFNVAPRAIEDALTRHPAILEAAVIGLPHDTLGQEVAAFVSLRPGHAASEQDLIDYTRVELGFQKPRRLTIVERLPRNAYGKVAKHELERLEWQAP